MSNSQNPYESPRSESLSPLEKGVGVYAPCPGCETTLAKKVGYTWWGGFLGPKILSHVRCTSCGETYNGKTGKSNRMAIVLYAVLGLGIGIVIGLWIARLL